MVRLGASTGLTAVTGLLFQTAVIDAFWRMPCRSRTGLARIDPIMDPGAISDHVHAIHGGGNINPSSTPQDLQSSDCTSCEVTQDKSAYWTPSLHFLYPNGTTVIVPQVGGMLAYYLLYPDASTYNGPITAFPEGFQMISGDKKLRNFTWPVPDPPKSDWSGDQVSQFALQQKALGFNCLNYGAAPEGSLYRHFMPDKDYLDQHCTDGLRLELMFPSCWNGKDLDSSDHRSHVAFPDLVMTGTCPEGFKTKLPSLFYETIWNTYAFAGIEGQFVMSQGDPTGYGYHGDFMMGWEESFLQSAVNECTNLSGQIQDCPLFNIQSDDTAAQCQMQVPQDLVNDNAAGPRNGLAVDVPIQVGPGYATAYPVILADSETYMKPTMAKSIIATQIVPTLTYSPAAYTQLGVTGNAVVAGEAPAQTGNAQPTATQAAATRAAGTSTISSISITTVPADATPNAAGAKPQVISTSTITRNGVILEVVVEQVVVTVTAPTGASSPPAPTATSTAKVNTGNGLIVGADGSVNENKKLRRRAHRYSHAVRGHSHGHGHGHEHMHTTHVAQPLTRKR